jgi:flotillin
MEITKERLRIIPQALAEAVKPMEKIGDVKIIDLGGRISGGGIGGGNGAGGAPAGNAAEALVNALLSYRLQSPVIDQVLREVGLSGGDPLKAMLSGLEPKPAVVPPAPTPAPAAIITPPPQAN